jgi:hypothetical protein
VFPSAATLPTSPIDLTAAGGILRASPCGLQGGWRRGLRCSTSDVGGLRDLRRRLHSEEAASIRRQVAFVWYCSTPPRLHGRRGGSRRGAAGGIRLVLQDAPSAAQAGRRPWAWGVVRRLPKWPSRAGSVLALLLTGGTLKTMGDRRLQAHGPEGWPNQIIVTSGPSGRVDSVVSSRISTGRQEDEGILRITNRTTAAATPCNRVDRFLPFYATL